MLQLKSKFPREVLLCRVGEFYEAIGIDACILVEYAGLNPCGITRSDNIPKAGCPVSNLRQTLDDLTHNGFSVCIVEEIQCPTQTRSRKGRFISGHAHPGSPYIYGLVEADHDLDFPEPMPVVGLFHTARGYGIISVLETMKTYSVEDGLPEEAVVIKLRTCQYHYLFLHASLKDNSSGIRRWGEFGDGGLLWGECSGKPFEWFGGNPVDQLLFQVKELYGLGDEIEFRNITISPKNRPQPLRLGTASQIGVIPMEGIPSLLKVLLPSNCKGLPALYMRNLLLNPPSFEIASVIQETCRLMNKLTCPVPDFTCMPPAKLVKLLELKEANHVEFRRIHSLLEELLHMNRNTELNEILKLLLDPAWVATGLKIDLETLIRECEWASCKISELISMDSESDHMSSSFPSIPNEFFEDSESSWRGRVKRVHIEQEFSEMERTARSLSLAVTEDFLPIISRIKATAAQFCISKGEIIYAREHEAVWFKGKKFTPLVWSGSSGELQIKQLMHAVDSKGRKVGEEWFTTMKVEDALMRYHKACEKAKARVYDLLRGLSADLQTKSNILVFASMLLIIAKALFAHVCEGKRRMWVFPKLVQFNNFENVESLGAKADGMKIVGLSPYWLDVAEGSAVPNTVDMQSLYILTGPNGGGKSSLLRSICAAAVLAICGLMLPAEQAVIPHFDSVMLHMKSFDSPVDGKSSFQVEMAEIRSVIAGASAKSLVLVDEICRGTETGKGTCIAASIVETLDRIRCLGVVSTHLHGLFRLPLRADNVRYKAMGAECRDGGTKPTWKLTDGVCGESLAFETARREGMPASIIERAQELYSSAYGRREITDDPAARFGSGREKIEIRDLESAVSLVCRKELMRHKKQAEMPADFSVPCVSVGAREQPPPSTVSVSCVYLMLRPDGKIYVGVTDDIQGRVHAHRSNIGMRDASFLYFVVPGKSIAFQLETLLINQLPGKGFHLANLADGHHRNFGTSNLPL